MQLAQQLIEQAHPSPDSIGNSAIRLNDLADLIIKRTY